MNPDEYRTFTSELTECVRAESRAIGLVAVGSMADRDYSADEWSDHDFFVITHPGMQEALRTSVSWLPRRERVVLGFRETEHGVTIVYADGHMLEFAVFDLEEIRLASVNRYRVLFDRGGVEERVAQVASDPAQPRDELFLFGKTVASALVAAGRGRRGETLSGAFTLTSATAYFARLLTRTRPADDVSILDEFDSLRRFERAYPEIGAELAAIVRLTPTAGGAALLDVLERELRPVRPDLPWRAVEAVRGRLSAAG
jgi:hypothetical protein